MKPSTWLVVCEGTETEANYFKNAVNFFNEMIDKEYRIKCEIKGMGKGTTSLVKATDRLLSYIDKCNTRTVPYGKKFVVFDKDNFNDSFDSAIKLCVEKDYIPLWSNTAIELWFLLYFDTVSASTDGKTYINKLNKYFKKCNPKLIYKKNDSHIFDILYKYGNHKQAIQRARKIMENYQQEKTLPSKCYNCTNVFKFFDEILIRITELN